MKKILLTLSLFLLAAFAHPIHAADWSALSTGDTNSFRAITQSEDNLVAAGSGGYIFYSADNGKTWTGTFSAQNVTFFDFATLPDGRLIAVGSGGINETSSDHGLTWAPFSFGIQKDVYGIDMKTVAGTSTGFLVGSGGTYKNYASSTGHWDTQTLGINSDLHGVEDRGNGTGWISGADGTIYKLVQGGNSWVSITSGTRETLNAIRFVSDTKGFIVGTMGTVLKTIDGGVTWSPVTIVGLSNQQLYSMDISGNQIVIAGDKILITSADAGETWQVKSFDGTAKKFFGAYIKDATHLFAVGSDDDVTSLVYQLVDSAIPSPDLSKPLSTSPTPGSLIKLKCGTSPSVNDPCKAVYFFTADGYRHAFTNDKVYFSWFTDFSTVKEVDATFLSLLTLGKNVTYRPGVKMVKFQSVPQVYAVAKGGVLRAILSEEIAAALYGTTWNKQIDDISDVFYRNYTFGTPILTSTDFDPAQARILVGSLSENF